MSGPYTYNQIGPDCWEVLFNGDHIKHDCFNNVRSMQETLMADQCAGLNAAHARRHAPDRGDGTSRTASHRPVPAAHRELPASEPAPVANPTIANGTELARRAYLSTGENQ